jgi:hypothetical protein
MFLIKIFKLLLNIECIYEYTLDCLLAKLYVSYSKRYVSYSKRYGNSVYKKVLTL